MNSATQAALISAVSVIATAAAQQLAIVQPISETKNANREANYECRNQLKLTLEMLHQEMNDE